MRNQRSGFTLLEVMMVMVMAALIIAMAVPKFGQLRESGRMKAARTQVISTLSTARAAAIQNGRPARWIRINNQIIVQSTNNAGNYVTFMRPVDFETQYKVTLYSTSNLVNYDARGFATGANNFKVYIRGMTLDSICVTNAGAVLLRGCL